jgi:hypothetical protein
MKMPTEKRTAINVDIDGVPFDIADRVDDIMQMGKEHFKLLAKQFGKSILEFIVTVLRFFGQTF